MKGQPEHFSKHSLERIDVRTKITALQIAQILHFRLAVELGVDVGTTKQRWLFWSPVDEDYYVAIQDTLDGTVITVLPSNYTSLQHEVLYEAKQLLPSLDVLYTKLDAAKVKDTPNYHVYVTIIDENGLRKSKRLFSAPGESCPDLPTFVDKVLDVQDVMEGIKSKGIDARYVEGVTIRQGRNGPMIFIEWDRLKKNGRQ